MARFKLILAWLLAGASLLGCLLVSQAMQSDLDASRAEVSRLSGELKKLHATDEFKRLEEARQQVRLRAQAAALAGSSARQARVLVLLPSARPSRIDLGAAGLYLECDDAPALARRLKGLPMVKNLQAEGRRLALQWQ